MKNKPPILVIDDDEAITSTVSAFLEGAGYPVKAVTDGREALQEVGTGLYPIVLSDIYIDDVSGIEILEAAKAQNPNAAVILMTARGSVRTSVEAERGGAVDYLAKPFEMRSLLAAVERAQCEAVGQSPEEPGEDLEQFGNMVGFSPAIVEVYKKIARSARSEETVLIVGETGVGKELVARAIHEHGARSQGPFVPVDAGAIPGTLWESEIFGALRGAYTGADRDRPGVLEAARGGTVFFDEIGEIPLDFQAKLLRFLQQKEFRPVGAGTPRKADVRVIAATHRSLEEMLKQGQFREDLFYRLNVLRIDVPPLRERRSDIPFLVRRFLQDAVEAAQKQVWLDPGVTALLKEFPWPGNVRELENTIRRLVALRPAGPVSAVDVRQILDANPPPEPEEEEPKDLQDLERRQILRVLQETGGNKTRAADVLGIQRRTLYKKLARMERRKFGHADEPKTPE